MGLVQMIDAARCLLDALTIEITNYGWSIRKVPARASRPPVYAASRPAPDRVARPCPPESVGAAAQRRSLPDYWRAAPQPCFHRPFVAHKDWPLTQAAWPRQVARWAPAAVPRRSGRRFGPCGGPGPGRHRPHRRLPLPCPRHVMPGQDRWVAQPTAALRSWATPSGARPPAGPPTAYVRMRSAGAGRWAIGRTRR